MRVNSIAAAVLAAALPVCLSAGVVQPAPTPEPTSMLMLGGGLAAIALFGTIRSRKR